jgi:hypothetical protein
MYSFPFLGKIIISCLKLCEHVKIAVVVFFLNLCLRKNIEELKVITTENDFNKMMVFQALNFIIVILKTLFPEGK